MPLKPHPTDPDKMVYVSRQYDMPDTPTARAYLAKVLEDDDTQVYGDALTIAYQSGYYDGKKAALAGRGRNFCERCGKRLGAADHIHTCTPPQRTWVDLPYEDILDLFDEHNVYGSKWLEFARSVETKLKEKNS